MIRTALCVAIALVVFPACKKKDDAASSAGAADKSGAADKGGGTAEKPVDKAAPAGPTKTTPKDLFTEFGDPKADAMALLDKYKAGATITGTIKTAPGDAAPTSAIMDVDGKNMIMMSFTEPPKGIKAGDTITATCKIGGESGSMMQVNDCVMAK
jgi:hypothetical protein